MKRSYSWSLKGLNPLINSIYSTGDITNEKMKQFAPTETDLSKIRAKVDVFINENRNKKINLLYFMYRVSGALYFKGFIFNIFRELTVLTGIMLLN